jgi:hypothetical protein
MLNQTKSCQRARKEAGTGRKTHKIPSEYLPLEQAPDTQVESEWTVKNRANIQHRTRGIFIEQKSFGHLKRISSA